MAETRLSSPGFVYEITNRLTGEIYVGQTTNPARRFKEHVKNSHNVKLRNAMRRYGEEMFRFGHFSKAFDTQEALDAAETRQIQKHFYAGVSLYNSMLVGGRGSRIKRSGVAEEVPRIDDPAINPYAYFKSVDARITSYYNAGGDPAPRRALRVAIVGARFEIEVDETDLPTAWKKWIDSSEPYV